MRVYVYDALDREPDMLCGECGDGIYAEEGHLVECFERFGSILCEGCFAEASEDDEDDGCCPSCGACPGFIGAECDETCAHALLPQGGPADGK